LLCDYILSTAPPTTPTYTLSLHDALPIWPCIERLIARIRRAFPEARLVVGGEHATAAWQHILESCPDVACVGLGEGEETICDLADRKSTRLNSSHQIISYAVFCLKKKIKE